MFDNLSEKFQSAFKKLSGQAEMSDNNIRSAMQEIRMALIEADVNFQVVKEFIDEAKEACMGEAVLKSVKPGEQAVKAVHDLLIGLMGASDAPLELESETSVIMMVGLHGSGKTTTTAKLANRLKKESRKLLLVAADVHRPAAIDQLEFLGKQLDIQVFSDREEKNVAKIAERALAFAKENKLNTVILDTAGRLQIDGPLVEELVTIKKIAKPDEILLVGDAALGQEAVSVADHFHEALGLTGIVLTKLDGDARGGAALSMRKVTGVPIKFVGLGEKIEDLDIFYPERMASRILGMGDVVTLVEKAAEQISEEEAMKLEEKMMKNKFDLQDFLNQLNVLKKMGGLGFLLKMLPGGKKLKEAMSMGESQLKKIEAMIQSMTKAEKLKPEIINLSRKQRISKGSGSSVTDITQLINRFAEMKKVMQQFSKMPGFGSGGGGGMPDMNAMLGGGGGGAFPGMGGGGMPAGFPGMGGGRGDRGAVAVPSQSLSDEEKKRLKRQRQKDKKKKKKKR